MLDRICDLRHTFGTRLADAGVDVVKDQGVDGSHFDCDNHALHPRNRSRKAWGDHYLVRVSTAEADTTTGSLSQTKYGSLFHLPQSFGTMVSHGGLEPLRWEHCRWEVSMQKNTDPALSETEV